MMNKPKKTPSTALEVWMKARNLNKTKLAEQTGIPRTTVGLACKCGPAESELPRLASALHVSEKYIHPDHEVSQAKEEYKKFRATVESLMKELSLLTPQALCKKAETIKSLLRQKDFEPGCETALNLLTKCNRAALSYMFHLLFMSDVDWSSLSPSPESVLVPSRTLVKTYMKYRDIRVNELEQITGIKRQTLSLIRTDSRRMRKMKENNKKKIANALHVDLSDLILDSETASDPVLVVNIPKILEDIRNAAQQCHPAYLEKMVSAILPYLKTTDTYMILLTDLLCRSLEPSRQKSLIDLLPTIAEEDFFQKDYIHDIQIIYYLTDDESDCMATFLFEPWVYQWFGVENSCLPIHWPDTPRKPDEFSETLPELFRDQLPDQHLVFPVEIPLDEEDPDRDLEDIVYEYIDDYLSYTVLNNISGPWQKAFSDFLSDNLEDAHIEPCTIENVEQGLPVRLYMREQQYKKLLSSMFRLTLPKKQISDLAKLFSRLREDPDWEASTLKKYGIFEYL